MYLVATSTLFERQSVNIQKKSSKRKKGMNIYAIMHFWCVFKHAQCMSWSCLVMMCYQKWIIITSCHILLPPSWGCDLAGTRLSGMKFASLIEIAALGSGPLHKSYKWHVSPVSWRATTPPAPPLTPASCGGHSYPASWCWCLTLWSSLYCSVSRTLSARTSLVKLKLNTVREPPDTCRGISW